MGAPMTFGQNASFKSIVSKCDGLSEDMEDSTIEARLSSMSGPYQPAMQGTEQSKATAKVVTVKRHPNDDPNWNGPGKDA
jgi:hypothetical protein